jgi:hypothetical protein
MEIAFSVAVEQLRKDKKQVSKHTKALLLDQKQVSKCKFLVSTTAEAIIV